MPRSFPDMASLKANAVARKFRQPEEGETEEAYRKAFATYMVDIDQVEAVEIDSGRGWDDMLPLEVLMRLASLRK